MFISLHNDNNFTIHLDNKSTRTKFDTEKLSKYVISWSDKNTKLIKMFKDVNDNTLLGYCYKYLFVQKKYPQINDISRLYNTWSLTLFLVFDYIHTNECLKVKMIDQIFR